jgi:hypothetical protein
MKWYNIVVLAAIVGVGAYMAYAICHIAIFDFDDFLRISLSQLQNRASSINIYQ